MPSVEEAARLFADPSPEYGPNVYYGLDNATATSIPADLDRIMGLGFHAVTFQAGRHMSAPYLSPGYFELVKILVREASKRELRVWIVDDGGYPSGFAGGKFSSETPELRMQALVVTNSIDLTPGMEFEDVMSPEFVSAVAYDLDSGRFQMLTAQQSHIRFTPPLGHWRVLIVEHQFRTSLTRSITNPTGAKDTSQSLEDYLDPAATRQFLTFEHEQYKKAVGEYFGNTILGFRGDEPDFSFSGLPYTPDIFSAFRKSKGYDIQPLAASLFLPVLTPEQKLIRADYTDVWSQLFRENFFKLQAEWCTANHLRYQVHINHEDDLPRLAVTEGDFFRDLTAVQVPGVDAIWHQIWKDETPDFPKLASSAAHLSGSAQAFTESFASYRPAPTVDDARFILDEQIVRGINLVEIMHYPFSTRMTSPLADPEWPHLMESVRRTTTLLSLGRPTESIALYVPSRALWMGDFTANTHLLTLSRELMQSQYSFDFVDDDSIAFGLEAVPRGLRTPSGNVYRAVLIPDADYLTAQTIHRLQIFARSGGHVIFFGHAPVTMVDTSMRTMTKIDNVRWGTIQRQSHLDQGGLKFLPARELICSPQAKNLRYVHRTLQGADIYYLLNEGAQPMNTSLTLRGSGTMEQWSPEDGEAKPVVATHNTGTITTRVRLAPYRSMLLVVRH